MISLVNEVKLDVQIIFKNGSTYTISKNTDDVSDDDDNFVTDVKFTEQTYVPSGNNIIGKVSDTEINIELKSLNGLLKPNSLHYFDINNNIIDNPYAGMMNKSARIKLTATYESDNVVELGTYYVDNWESGNSNSTQDDVTITAVGLFTKIKNITLPKFKIDMQSNFYNYIKTALDKINSSLPNYMQIIYNENILKRIDMIYTDDWNVWYNNIETNNLENLFNCIAESTLSHVYIDRDHRLMIDPLIDDYKEKSVCELDSTYNITEYQTSSTSIYDYTGVKTKYIKSIREEDKQIESADNIKVKSGLNTISLEISSNKCSNIHSIECSTDSTTSIVYCKSFDIDDKEIELNIKSDSNTSVDINIFGSLIKETKSSYKYKPQTVNGDGGYLVVNNKILRGDTNINRYTQEYSRLINLNDGLLQVSGWFNPSIRLGDTVGVLAGGTTVDDKIIEFSIGRRTQSVNKDNSDYTDRYTTYVKYKVVKAEYDFNQNYKCKFTLMRTAVDNTEYTIRDTVDQLGDRVG